MDSTVPSVDSDQSTFHPNAYRSVEYSWDSYLFVETGLDPCLSVETSPDFYQMMEASPSPYWSVETSPASYQSRETNPDSYWSVETSSYPYWSVESSPASCQSAVSSRSRGCDQWLGIEVLDIISEDWNTWFGTLCVLLWLMYLILLWKLNLYVLSLRHVLDFSAGEEKSIKKPLFRGVLVCRWPHIPDYHKV